MQVTKYVDSILNDIKEFSPGQDEFYQAAEEVLNSITPLLEKEPK